MVTRITIKDAAKRLGVSEQFVRVALQKGAVNFGIAIKMSSQWAYHISPGLFEAYCNGKGLENTTDEFWET